jgi:hypothetical protein
MRPCFRRSEALLGYLSHPVSRRVSCDRFAESHETANGADLRRCEDEAEQSHVIVWLSHGRQHLIERWKEHHSVLCCLLVLLYLACCKEWLDVTIELSLANSSAGVGF